MPRSASFGRSEMTPERKPNIAKKKFLGSGSHTGFPYMPRRIRKFTSYDVIFQRLATPFSPLLCRGSIVQDRLCPAGTVVNMPRLACFVPPGHSRGLSMPKVGKTLPVDASPADRLLPVHEVARLCGLSPRSVWRHSDSGTMPRPLQVGGSRRWRESDLRAWLAAGCPACREPAGVVAR